MPNPHFPVLLLLAATTSLAQTLPVIDLGKSVHRAQLNATGEYYSFNNIPYAEPPLGELRFRAPIPLLSVNRTVNDGSQPRKCLQSGAPWFQHSIPLVIQRLIEGGISPPMGPPPSAPGEQSEDCLLLDVSVPKAAYDAQVAGTLAKPLPVMVWIHGGGYIEGAKNEVNPAGLIAQSRRDGAPGVVFVAINYRLGLFGFPPRTQWMWDTASNAALLDQRLALEWVRFNIRRFGGNPKDITVIGESAGAGCIVSHLSAFGGIDFTLPFDRAIIQSPAIKPHQDATLNAQLYNQFLSIANVSSYSEARAKTSAQLAAVNAAMIGTAPFASTVFGPNVDGLYIPDYPGELLAKGRVNKNIEVLVAHNLDEGLLFTDPRIPDDAGFRSYLQGLMPSAPASKINTLATTIYPPDFSGAQPYTNQVGRTKLAIAEGLIDCFAFGTSLAYSNQTRGYLFSIFPGMHAQDTSYTFFNGGASDGLGIPVSADAAVTMQRWFVDFAAKGVGAGSTATQLPLYGSSANVANITGTGFPVVRDPAANARCRFWLSELTA
ncbi:Alpha/Beta hydrolase protein [Immersiella caudata]|uniref:Carboxylic ester hydrolase n=1 Tax=Immersiella caudata TaxID=314043 RepID=A0AA39WY57_9PEZI|nr:Alpha/Beta hydrolase protein [Immersiella caudata]